MLSAFGGAIISRLADIARFYKLLALLERRIGGTRRLLECDGQMGWPERGVYFFFEPGEPRTRSGSGPRVVRVGSHALTETSQTMLWNRLHQHRGHLSGTFAGGGNHRGSVFRKHLGYALIARDHLNVPTWGVGNSAPRSVRVAEHELERRVSQYVRGMPFLWLDVSSASAHATRGYLESNCIALLSNSGKLSTGDDAIDIPSPKWLGRFCKNQNVVASGLWNSNHVSDGYEPEYLEVLEELVERDEFLRR